MLSSAADWEKLEIHVNQRYLRNNVLPLKTIQVNLVTYIPNIRGLVVKRVAQEQVFVLKVMGSNPFTGKISWMKSRFQYWQDPNFKEILGIFRAIMSSIALKFQKWKIMGFITWLLRLVKQGNKGVGRTENRFSFFSI